MRPPRPMMGPVKALGAMQSWWLALLALAGCGGSAADRSQLPSGEQAAICAGSREAIERLAREHPEFPIDKARADVEKFCRDGARLVPVPTPLPAVSAPGCDSLAADDERPTPIRRRRIAAPDSGVPFFAARAGALPADGPATVGGVELPSGSRCPHYWATDGPVPDALALASRLTAAFPHTGLWPILWDVAEDPDHYAWSGGEIAAVDRLDARTVLRKTWGAYLDSPRNFPGLAPGSHRSGAAPINPFRTLARSGTLTSAPESGWVLLLVPVNRPADVITMLGFIQSEVMPEEALTAVVRSWEERFSAVVTTVGPGGLGLAVGEPPRGADQALTLAAEQTAFAPEHGEVNGPEELPNLGERLHTGSPGFGVNRSRHFWAFGWPD
jgi:Domain of unknown function (DUF4253)